MRFAYKLKQVEFDLGSKRFFILFDEYKAHTPTRMKVFDFKTIFTYQNSTRSLDQNTVEIGDIKG